MNMIHLQNEVTPVTPVKQVTSEQRSLPSLWYLYITSAYKLV